MKLVDIYTTRLNETLDKALPFKKISDTRYVIEIDDQHKLYVVLYSKPIQQYKCLSVLFINPDSSEPLAVTGLFNGPGAIRVFSTIVAILSQLQFDLVFFTPDDINVDFENKKASLYGLILKKMERIGKLLASETIHLPEFDKPIFVGIKKGYELTIPQLQEISRMFARSKGIR